MKEQTVTLRDVTLRDGLQRSRMHLSVEAKLFIIRELIAAGIDEIEVTAFTHPRVFPQFTDADELCRALPQDEPVCFSSVVPNEKGYERAVRVGTLQQVAFLVGATDLITQRYLAESRDERVASISRLCERAKLDGLGVRVYVSGAFGQQGREPELGELISLVDRLFESGCGQVALADTESDAYPGIVQHAIRELAEHVDLARVALHLHDGAGLALANARTAIEHGVSALDGAIGGVAVEESPESRNVAIEQLARLVERMGAEATVDSRALCNLATRVTDMLTLSQYNRDV